MRPFQIDNEACVLGQLHLAALRHVDTVPAQGRALELGADEQQLVMGKVHAAKGGGGRAQRAPVQQRRPRDLPPRALGQSENEVAGERHVVTAFYSGTEPSTLVLAGIWFQNQNQKRPLAQAKGASASSRWRRWMPLCQRITPPDLLTQ